MSAEALFSALRDSCPRRHMYPETSWVGSAFVHGLICLYQPNRVAEVGCHSGCTSIYIAQALYDIGAGSFIGYELKENLATMALDRLSVVWPGGSWKINIGDFFETCEPDPVDFAFIDIDPKSSYIPVYERLTLASNCVIVAHDLTYAPSEVGALADRLAADGFAVHLYQPERGFVVAVRS